MALDGAVFHHAHKIATGIILVYTCEQGAEMGRIELELLTLCIKLKVGIRN